MNTFLNNQEWSAIGLSLQIALIAVICALPFAILLGYVLAKKSFFGRRFLKGLCDIPLVLPPVTIGYILLMAFGKAGCFSFLGIDVAFTKSAAILASVVVSFPLMIRSIIAGFELVDNELLQASYALGVSKLRTILKVLIPLSLPAILSGMVLAFARSVGEFGATITFAGNIEGETQTIPLAIYNNMQIPGNDGLTWRLVLVSVVIAISATLLSEVFLNKMKKRVNN